MRTVWNPSFLTSLPRVRRRRGAGCCRFDERCEQPSEVPFGAVPSVFGFPAHLYACYRSVMLSVWACLVHYARKPHPMETTHVVPL